MSGNIELQSNVTRTNPYSITCHLRRKEVASRRGIIPFMSEIELHNESVETVEIEYWLTALHYLNLIVRDSNGKVVSTGHYADRFSPTLDPRILRLEPGESFHAHVHLFATAPDALNAPGSYSVQAVYEYNGFRAESEILTVTVE